MASSVGPLTLRRRHTATTSHNTAQAAANTDTGSGRQNTAGSRNGQTNNPSSSARSDVPSARMATTSDMDTIATPATYAINSRRSYHTLVGRRRSRRATPQAIRSIRRRPRTRCQFETGRRYIRPGTAAKANARNDPDERIPPRRTAQTRNQTERHRTQQKCADVHLRECSDRCQRRDDHCGRDAQAAARNKPPHRDCDRTHHSHEAQLLRVPGLERQLRQVKKGDCRTDCGEQQAPGEQPYWNARKRRAPEPDDEGHDSRRIVRHRDADDPVKDLLPQVVGRSVLCVDVVVERKALQELLDRYEEISFVVVPLELCEDEAMADPREYAQETRGREPDTKLVRGGPTRVSERLRPLRPCAFRPESTRLLPLFGKLQASSTMMRR